MPFIVLTISMFFLYTGFYSLIPVMPLYIKGLGGNELAVGVLVGVYTLAAVVFRPFVGRLVDGYGRRAFIMGGLLVFTVILFIYNGVGSLLALLLLRFCHGASWAVSNSALGTAITDVIPDSRRGEGMGWYGISMTLAMAAGPYLGSVFLENGSLNRTFWAAALLSSCALMLVMLLKMPKYKRRNAGQLSPEKPKWSIMMTIFLMAISFGGVTTFLPLFAESVHVHSGLFFLVYAVVLTLIRPIAGKMTDRRGESYVIIPALFFIVAALMILSAAQGLAGMLLSAVLYAIGFGSAQPALQAAALRLTSPDRKGAANAAFFTAFDLGIGLGSIALGWISHLMGYRMLFAGSAVSVACSAAVFTILVRRKLAAPPAVRLTEEEYARGERTRKLKKKEKTGLR